MEMSLHERREAFAIWRGAFVHRPKASLLPHTYVAFRRRLSEAPR